MLIGPYSSAWSTQVLAGSSGATKSTSLTILSLSYIIWANIYHVREYCEGVANLSWTGGTEESFTLNFSRPGAQVIAQVSKR